MRANFWQSCQKWNQELWTCEQEESAYLKNQLIGGWWNKKALSFLTHNILRLKFWNTCLSVSYLFIYLLYLLLELLMIHFINLIHFMSLHITLLENHYGARSLFGHVSSSHNFFFFLGHRFSHRGNFRMDTRLVLVSVSTSFCLYPRCFKCFLCPDPYLNTDLLR